MVPLAFGVLKSSSNYCVPVLVEDDECEGDGHGDHDDDLGGVEAPLLVLHVVEEGVGQRLDLRHAVVRQRQARRRRHPREEDPHESLQGKKERWVEY